MKHDMYYLVENRKLIKSSRSFEKVLNATSKTENGIIFFNWLPVWVQKPNIYTRHIINSYKEGSLKNGI